MASVFACAIFGAVCGSSVATAATIGLIAIPEMEKRGYQKALMYGPMAAGGPLGILIPPSIPMIIYGVMTETSVGQLYIAGILPGILANASGATRRVAPTPFHHTPALVLPHPENVGAAFPRPYR